MLSLTARCRSRPSPRRVQGAKSGSLSCYFNSYEQCMTTKSGLGGHCIRSTYCRG
jgi:hypothetical protein